MQETSTSRFMAVWTLAMLPFAVVNWLLSQSVRFYFAAFGLLGHLLLQTAVTFALAILAGLVQARLLARHRVRVPAWGLAVALGSLGGALLGSMASTQLVSLARSMTGSSTAVLSWISSILWSSTFALSLGGAESFALWGRRWPSEALLWISGVLALRVMPMLALRLAPDGPDGAQRWLMSLTYLLVNGAVVAAGTAWLLDRLVFRRPPSPDSP